jgi:hypothetical protein
VRRALVAATALAASLMLVPTSAATPPGITYTIDGIVGTNGWYRGSSHGDNVILHWSVSPDTLSTNCLPAVTVPGPTTGVTETCWASNNDGTTIAVTNPPIKIDADPPTEVASHIARSPDHNGWYNHPLPVTWSGSDATSGLAGCSSVNYAGPEGAGVFFSGGCTDNAGNTTLTGVTINYDATPPVFSGLLVDSTSDADVVRWASSDPTARIVVRRAARGNSRRKVVFNGTGSSFVDKSIQAGVEYVYTLRAVDQAGNESAPATVAGLPKVLTLRRMAYVPRAAPQPILRWEPMGGARYYNVQLFRGKKRVLAAWPDAHQFGVPKAWKWDGRTRRLRPGHYHWYVWAGFGARSFAQYRAVGSAQFIVPQGSQH